MSSSAAVGELPDNAERIQPQPAQAEFLASSADIVFYGGQAGGGKTYALLLEPLYDIDNPDFGAVIFRRTMMQVMSEGGLWDTAGDLYPALGATAVQSPRPQFTFPSGARVTFAHMEHEKNRLDWQGAQIPLIEFDELTHFTWKQFSYMLSRNRSTSGAKSRIRATLNPDADHWVRDFIDWWIGEDGFARKDRSGVIRWFVVKNDEVVWADTKEELEADYPGCLPKSFTFISASLDDNPILTDIDPSYRGWLEALPKVERERLLGGNWNVRPQAGDYFQRRYFTTVDAAPSGSPVTGLERVRAWDLAATEEEREKDDPDWTVGLRVSQQGNGRFCVEHMERFRESPHKVRDSVKTTASQDGKDVTVRLPQDPGQAGKAQARDFVSMLAGYTVNTKPVTGSKTVRAGPASSQAEAGNIDVVRGAWNEAFFAELEAFPTGGHDDIVDALSDAIDELTTEDDKPRVWHSGMKGRR